MGRLLVVLPPAVQVGDDEAERTRGMIASDVVLLVIYFGLAALVVLGVTAILEHYNNP